MITTHQSIGGHNTYILVIVLSLLYWLYSVSRQLYESLRVLVILQPETAQDTVLTRLGLRRPPQSSVLVLPGVNELVDEFKVLNRRHIEQIIAASADLRLPPQTPLVKQIAAHINAEDISYDGRVSFTVDATRPCTAFACLNLPLGVVEDEAGRGDRGAQGAATAWWRDVVLSSIFPFRKTNFQSLPVPASRGSQQLSPLRALAASGTRVPAGLNAQVQIQPSAISAESARTFVPLVLGVATDDGMELTLCRLQGERRVEVVKQILLPSFVAISGLYGLEENQTNECMICCDERINTALLPCCHCALCENCAPNLRDGRCPICRVAYTGYVSLPFRDAGNPSVLSPLLSTR